MSTPDPVSTSSPNPPDASIERGVTPATTPPAASARRTWALTLSAGLLAGLASWAVGEATLTAFKPRMELFEGFGGGTRLEPNPRSELRADARNAALAYATLGAALGAALGLAAGVGRDSVRRGAAAGVVGVVVGAALGAGVTLALVPLFQRDRAADPLSHDLMTPLLVHAGIWAAVGAAGGLALGVGSGGDGKRIARAAVGGLAGAALAAAVYEMIGATAFPLADTPRPVSLTWGTRLLAHVLVASLAAAGATALALDERRGPSVSGS